MSSSVLLLFVLSIIVVVSHGQDKQSLEDCSNNAEEAIACVGTTITRMIDLSRRVDTITSLRDKTWKIKKALLTVDDGMAIATKVPGIRGFSSNLDRILDGIRRPIVKLHDGFIVPIDNAIKPHKNTIKRATVLFRYSLTSVRATKYICKLWANRIKVDQCGKKNKDIFADYSRALKQAVVDYSNSVGKFRAGCEAIRERVNRFIGIQSIYEKIYKFQKKTSLLGSFFKKLQEMAKKKFCIPNPFKWIGKLFRRRRKASNWCLSVKDVINEFAKWEKKAKAIIKPVMNFIKKILNKRPTLNVPAMPKGVYAMFQIQKPDFAKLDPPSFKPTNLTTKCTTKLRDACNSKKKMTDKGCFKSNDTM